MADFPKLIPAFTAKILLDKPFGVGAVSSTGPITLVPFVPSSGSLISEPSYPIQVSAIVLHGGDYIRQDPSGKHVRLDVHSTLQDKETGGYIKFSYKGIIDINPGTAAVLSGRSDAKTTPFGDAFAHVVFETGSEQLRGLEEKVFVASGRFIIESWKPPIVEYKISQLVS